MPKLLQIRLTSLPSAEDGLAPIPDDEKRELNRESSGSTAEYPALIGRGSKPASRTFGAGRFKSTILETATGVWSGRTRAKNMKSKLIRWQNALPVARTFPGTRFRVPAILRFALPLFPALQANAGSGDIFVVCAGQLGQNNGQISELTASGAKSAFANVGNPYGLAFDGNGNLFVGDETGIIYKYGPDGSRTTFVSGLGNALLGLAFTNGYLYAAEATSMTAGEIFKFASDGSESTFATDLTTPIRMVFNSGYLYVADAGAGAIYKYAANGTRTIFASGLSPECLAVDADGNLFEGDGSGFIYKFASNGGRTIFASGLGANTIAGLTFDSGGNLFASDYNAGDVYEFTTNASKSTFVTGLSGPLGLAFLPVVPPVLTINPTNSNRVIVSWSSFSTVFTVQTNSDLTTTNWVNSGSPISISNGTNESTVIPVSPMSPLFFRLNQ